MRTFTTFPYCGISRRRNGPIQSDKKTRGFKYIQSRLYGDAHFEHNQRSQFRALSFPPAACASFNLPSAAHKCTNFHRSQEFASLARSASSFSLKSVYTAFISAIVFSRGLLFAWKSSKSAVLTARESRRPCFSSSKGWVHRVRESSSI